MAWHQNKTDLDRNGYRKNVGIIVCNDHHQVLWARRSRHDGWQFPQGGVEPEESPLDAAYRELFEEVGLEKDDVGLLGATDKWLHYDVPNRPRSYHCRRRRAFRGQKQRWFLFRLLADEASVRLDHSEEPVFDQWTWVDYWSPVEQIVQFKRSVYIRALTELEPLLLRM